ncbi:MAG: preprotein translocase subunit YajC [Ignavibacteriales bacterium]|nr:preprotein translocase subunit YajC [Ignavibacteriales bacterium]
MFEYSLLLMAPQDGSGSSSMLGNVFFILAIFAVMYFLMIRPQRKQQREREAMLTALKKGDKVLVGGGIHGSIVGIEEKTLLVQIADNVKVKIERTAVTTVLKEAEVVTK